jgi:acetyl-CoA acetyltransferase
VNSRSATAIIGVAATEQGELPGRSADQIAAEAIKLALDDAGLTKADVDGLITCRAPGQRTGIDEEVGALIGLNPRFGATLDYGSANFSLHLAVMAILTGRADTVVLAYGTNMRSSGTDFGISVGGGAQFGALAGLVHVAGPAALAFRRHQHLYGTTEEQLAMVAVSQREWAAMNPLAIFRDPLTVDDYLAQPYVASPLRRADLTMISDGGAALVLTHADLVSASPNTPAWVVGIEQQSAFRGYQNSDNLLRPWLGETAARLWANTGLTAKDMDAVYVQDATSVWVLQMLEWYGFCDVGEGGPFLADGNTRPGGRMPVNTNGGQLSESYMWGWLHMVEAVRQLRGECGPRQVPGVETVLDCSSHDFLKGAASILSTHR